ncbi:metallopeptidase [Pyrenochaeta sp. DS3sAY3a]|nr:metallopeptidase [Pyrenochaeta sp. DS3sAY3a]
MVASDSPCLIDCPPHKGAGLSSAHSNLDAAIAKLRMTAYMWQAMTAEDMRLKGLGRRSFRLDEEWTVDTVSRAFVNAKHDQRSDQEGATRSTAKVNLVRSEKLVRDIRDDNIAQQYDLAQRKNDLFDIFMDALKQTGGPFLPEARPVVAGLILDSHYNPSRKIILGHAALGCHNLYGISLGMFGSHLTYSWPRFLEEVVETLTDVRAPGEKVGNDNGECGTMWEACTIGQGAHLHEVGHAFGSPHRSGIMERGYAQDWPKWFLTKTAFCRRFDAEGEIVDNETNNNARWNLADALAFRMLPHFRLPSDPAMTADQSHSSPEVKALFSNDESVANLYISSKSGIARVSFNHKEEAMPTARAPSQHLNYPEHELQERFDRAEPLHLEVLGFNGKIIVIRNVWNLLVKKTYIRIPGSSLRLSKRSVTADLEEMDETEYYEWAQLLREKGTGGSIHRATSIDLRVGCIWDGGVVKYEDGHKSHWGPMFRYGHVHTFGGHASEEIHLPANGEITCIEVNKGYGGQMAGVRVHLANGTARGHLNTDSDASDVVKLEPAANETIVGFFGKSYRHSFSGVTEFGILTAPREVGLDGLPSVVFDLPELKNTAGIDDDQVRGQSGTKRMRLD